MGSEVLLERPSSLELVARCDYPESGGRVGAYKPVDPVILVVARVLVLVINLITSKISCTVV